MLLSRLRFGRGSLWKMGLGLILGLALCVWLARDVPLGEVWTGLANVQPVWVGLAFLSIVVNTVGKMVRWRGLFPGLHRPGIRSLASSLLIGQLANALLPARLGDVLRAHVLGMEQETSRALALGTIAVEKAFDIMGLLACAGLTVAWTGLPAWLYVPLIVLAGAGSAIIGLALLRPESAPLAWTERWLASRSWRVGAWLAARSRALLAGLAAMRQPWRVIETLSWSAVIWASAAATNYLVFLAFGLHLSVGAALLLLVSLTVGVVPPSSPAKLGVFHSIVVFALTAFGVERSSGLAYAVGLHFLVYAPQIVPGAILLAWGLPRASAPAVRWQERP